jgi:hypothetical protein
MTKENVCYYVAIHIGEPDWPEPICIGKTIQEVLDLLDEYCGYPKSGNTKDKAETTFFLCLFFVLSVIEYAKAFGVFFLCLG